MLQNLDPRIIGMPVNVANVDFTTSPWTGSEGLILAGIVYNYQGSSQSRM